MNNIFDWINKHLRPEVSHLKVTDPNEIPSEIVNELRNEYLNCDGPRAVNNPNCQERADFVRGGLRQFRHDDRRTLGDDLHQIERLFSDFFNLRNDSPDVFVDWFQGNLDDNGEKHPIGGYDFGVFNSFHNGNKSLNGGKSKSLRDEMLHGDGDDDDTTNRLSLFDHVFNFPFRARIPWDDFPTNRGTDDQRSDSDMDNDPRPLSDIFKYKPYDEQGSRVSEGVFGLTNLFKFSTTKSRRVNADGSVEEREVKKDSEGNEYSEVMRTIGDRSHKVTMKKNYTGEIESSEELINMNQDDVKSFDEVWESKRKKDARSDIVSENNGWPQFRLPWF